MAGSSQNWPEIKLPAAPVVVVAAANPDMETDDRAGRIVNWGSVITHRRGIDNRGRSINHGRGRVDDRSGLNHDRRRLHNHLLRLGLDNRWRGWNNRRILNGRGLLNHDCLRLLDDNRGGVNVNRRRLVNDDRAWFQGFRQEQTAADARHHFPCDGPFMIPGLRLGNGCPQNRHRYCCCQDLFHK